MRRPPRRFGYGEFDEPNRWRTTAYLERQILAEAATQELAILDELADVVFPFCRALAVDHPDWKSERLNWDKIKDRAETGDPGFSALRDALLAWTQKWFKDTPRWLLLEAAETLDSWRWGGPGTTPEWYFGGELDLVQYFSPINGEEVPFEFEHPGWPFWRQQQADWVRELDAAYEIARSNYLQRWTEVACDLDLVRTEEMRERSAWHIPAFVRFQFLSESKADILSSLKPKVSTIRQLEKVFKGIAAEANIKLRREPPGRPKGKRDRHRGKRG